MRDRRCRHYGIPAVCLQPRVMFSPSLQPHVYVCMYVCMYIWPQYTHVCVCNLYLYLIHTRQPKPTQPHSIWRQAQSPCHTLLSNPKLRLPAGLCVVVIRMGAGVLDQWPKGHGATFIYPLMKDVHVTMHVCTHILA